MGNKTKWDAWLSRLSRTICAMVVVGFLGLIAGCVTTSTQNVALATGPIKPDQSRVCVYALAGMGALPAKISDGDSAIGDLAGHGYVCWDRAPGKCTLRAVRPHGRGVWGDSEASLPLDLVGGQTYYVQACLENTTGPLQLAPLVSSALTTFRLVPKPQLDASADLARECKAPALSGPNGK